ncbi:MAG: M15 family metallopeptidase [Gammaproteobacteria bacterium]|jgi:hypothetical protein|nr:M15 family metallopeptidase [Gammaproteobacteria bacterium]
MAAKLTPKQITGLDESHLITLSSGHRLHAAAARAFKDLKQDARNAGFKLAIASSFRSYKRQLGIWNGKVRGRRLIYDDNGAVVPIETLSQQQLIEAILRFSALPGASRHHWGTDLDVYDERCLPKGYELQLSPQEVAPGGLFDALHCWLDERMARGRSHDFYRPYADDRGGVSPERWHLSFAPLSQSCESMLGSELLQQVWDQHAPVEDLLLREAIEQRLPDIFERYIKVPDNWCAR